MTLFLEGPVHWLRVRPDDARNVYSAVRESELYDRQLKMYRCCTWLKDEPYEIGRIKSYARGWIENESVYTHMEYKWLLEVLRSGLYEEFFEDISNALVPFLNPAVYGRSVLENCSFIASSVFPDPRSHGRAFQPRLSGVTSEFLEMWTLMVAGEHPFHLDEAGDLRLQLRPALHPRFFLESPRTVPYIDPTGQQHEIELPADSFAFKFLGKVLVVYSNPTRAPTYGDSGVGPAEYKLTYFEGVTQVVAAETLGAELAHDVREARVARIDVKLG